jgi:hypothetical protein
VAARAMSVAATRQSRRCTDLSLRHGRLDGRVKRDGYSATVPDARGSGWSVLPCAVSDGAETDLAGALEFSSADLGANRDGVLSESQRARFDAVRAWGWPLRWRWRSTG